MVEAYQLKDGTMVPIEIPEEDTQERPQEPQEGVCVPWSTLLLCLIYVVSAGAILGASAVVLLF